MPLSLNDFTNIVRLNLTAVSSNISYILNYISKSIYIKFVLYISHYNILYNTLYSDLLIPNVLYIFCPVFELACNS